MRSMPIIPDEDIIDMFISKMKKRYPDCRVVNDAVSKEVRIVEEDLTFRYAYIVKLFYSMNW